MTLKSKIPPNVTDARLLKSMARRRGIKLGTTSQAYISTSETAESTSGAATSDPSVEISGPISEPVNGKPVVIPLEDPDQPSVDLRRQPKGIIRWIKYLPGRIRRFYQILNPPLTPEQLEGRELFKLEKSRNKLGGREARKYARLASEKLAQLGLRELLNSPSPDKPKRLKLVRWGMWTRDQLFTKIILSMRTDPGFITFPFSIMP
jgi:hypothetical protein